MVFGFGGAEIVDNVVILKFLFFDKNPNLDIFGQLSFQDVVYGPSGSYFLLKSPSMDRPDHTLLVEGPYRDLTDQIFLVGSPYMDPKSVHFWKSPHIWTLSQSISGYFINRGKAFFFLFSESTLINWGGLLTGGMG